MKEKNNLLKIYSIKNLDKRLLDVMEYLLKKDPIKYKTQTKIGKIIEYPQTNLSAALNGNEKYLTENIVDKFCQAFPELSKNWLLTGEGEMLLHNEKPKNIEIRNEIIPVPEDDYMVVEFEDLEIAAGKLGGSDISELPETKKRLVPKEYANGKYLVARVYGHSMDDNTKRSLSDGEEVLIKQYTDFIENLPIRTKLFAIVTNDGSRVVKQITKVDKENKKIICHSFNPTWEDYPVNFDEILQIFTVEKKVKSNIFF